MRTKELQEQERQQSNTDESQEREDFINHVVARLLDSEEQAVDEAIPPVAEDAVDLIRNLESRTAALEQELAHAYAELRKLSGNTRGIFDRDVWDRARAWGAIRQDAQDESESAPAMQLRARG